jgi:hypothetical protein
MKSPIAAGPKTRSNRKQALLERPPAGNRQARPALLLSAGVNDIRRIFVPRGLSCLP